ncbi:MAG: Gmad2 immunoglobulin-like domain-containing protein [Patescibacteria group bacterium]|nr:Gmad2 immunoglobulin-like domain-containing protein [bacterium]MDZ4240851.1 Gmad2 immunoglobulin-like domain-containing protein [Patescibacteria group bacterium]
MISRKNLALFLCLALFASVVIALVVFQNKKYVPIRSFEECVKAGYPVLESYPRKCKAPNSEFVEDVGNEIEKQDIIRVSVPRPGDSIKSPLTISGEARGYWFFEASFPIHLFDASGNKIATAIATAQGEWMTQDFVPFKAVLTFNSVPTERGMLIFEKDNPSGLSENADELRMPVEFSAKAVSSDTPKECLPTGCSGQICADEDVVTTCEWTEQYACYQDAQCGRQTNGKCGWTQTSQLTSCLDNAQ